MPVKRNQGRSVSDNLIPSEKLANCRPWDLPDISSAQQTLASAEKEDRERSAKKDKEEFVEDVAADEDLLPLTAERLNEITESAEKEGRERGYAEGFAQGIEEGRTQGLSETRQQVQEQCQRLAGIAEALLEPLDKQDEALEKMLVQMVQKLTRTIIKRELLTDSSHILAVVQQAVEALPVGSKNLKVRLNPDDLALVETFAEEHQKDWQFIGDAELLPGGCRIETLESSVDYTIEQRLQRLLEQLETKQLAVADEVIPDQTIPDQAIPDSAVSDPLTPATEKRPLSPQPPVESELTDLEDHLPSGDHLPQSDRQQKNLPDSGAVL